VLRKKFLFFLGLSFLGIHLLFLFAWSFYSLSSWWWRVAHGVLLGIGGMLCLWGFREEERKGRGEFPYLSIDGEGRILSINRTLEDLFGYSREELRYRPFWDFLPLEERETARSRFETWARNLKRRPRTFLLPVVAKDGSQRIVRVRPLFSPRDEFLAFTLEDATRHRLVRTFLHGEIRRLRKYLDAVQDILVVLDARGKIRHINAMGSRLLGKKRRELIGKDLRDFLSARERERVTQVFRRLLAGKTLLSEERVVEFLTPCGNRLLRLNHSLFHDKEKETEIAISGVDITEEVHYRKMLESEYDFHGELLALIYGALREHHGSDEELLGKILRMLQELFSAQEVGYVEKKENTQLVVKGYIGSRERRGHRMTVFGESFLSRSVFVGEIRYDDHTLSLFPEKGTPPALVLPVFPLHGFMGFFFLVGKEKNDFDLYLQRAQIVAQMLELVFYRRKTEEELFWLSSHDVLTETLNSRAFRLQGEEMLAIARRYGKPLSLLFLDLNDFKSVNDRFGHRFGDKILYLFAQHLRQNLRQSDILFRLGGDEFVVLLPETPRTRAEEFRLRLEETSFFLEEGEEVISLSFSSGIASFPEDAETLDALIEFADQAMYARKRCKKGDR